MKNDYAKLEEDLNSLRLRYISENFKQLAYEASAKSVSHIAYLESLIEGEAALRYENSIKNRIKNAKFPYRKSMEQFNWNHPSKINRMQIENILRLDFIEQKKNVIFLGGCGVGKTHVTLAIAEKACINGYSVLFAPAIDIINTLSAANKVNSLDKALKIYISPKLLVIDELGYLPVDKQGANLLFQVISKRYETGSIILTSNRAFKEWGKIFDNDATITSAVLDRMLHHSEVVVIEGKSYRMKDKTEN